MFITKETTGSAILPFLFDCTPYAQKVYEVVKKVPKYVDPKVRYNARERYVHYWTKIHQYSHPYEVMEKLGVKYRGGLILPQVFVPLWNKQIKSVKTRRISQRVSVPKNRYTVLENEEGEDYDEVDRILEGGTKFSFISDNLPKEKIRVKGKKPFDWQSMRELISLIKQQQSIPKMLKFRDQVLLKALKDKIRSLRAPKKMLISEYINNKIYKDMLISCYRESFIKSTLDKEGLSIVYDYQKDLIEQQMVREGNYIQLLKPKLEAQMDTMAAQGEKVCPEIVSQGNTLQESQRGASQGVPAKKVSRRKKIYSRLASAESSPDYGDLTNRFFPHITREWKGQGEHPKNKEILNLTLPLDFVVKHPNAANCILFNSYGYWDGDMEVKIMVNSNKFQVGQLQMSWYYGQDYEKNFERRNNVYIASQQAHCLVSASTSNEGLLYIPFRYYKPKMGTKNRTDDPGHLNLGNLSIKVLNPLRSPSSTYNACTFTISFRFVNSNFSGMIARDLGRLEPNMFAVRAAVRVLEEMDADPQRDNPPSVRPPNPMVPWSAHSWCIGDKLVEPINTLRLQAVGQTPHPSEVTPELDEMSVKNIVTKFGLYKTVTWSANMRQGTLLFSMDGAPTQPWDKYHSSLFDGTNCYSLPPIGVLANLYAYWRGTIELRLDAITSPFHTGRLLLAYIPRVMDEPTFEQAKSSPHMILDLQGENRQFVFNIPYIADRPWWHNKAFSNVLPPSRVYCFVMNELVPMDNVVNEVDINIYMRGCDDFEFSIPVTPHIGLSTYNARVVVPTSNLAATKDGYMPMFVGEWRYFVRENKDKGSEPLVILRYGDVSDHVSQFDNLIKGKVYEPDLVKNREKIRGKNNVIEWYIVGVDIDVENNKCPYATFFSNKAKALRYAATYDRSYVDVFTEESGWFDNEYGKRRDDKIYFKLLETNLSDYEMEANMDERSTVSTTCEAGMLDEVQTTRSGLDTFGESFSDLKSLLRRYQLYAAVDRSFNINSSNKTYNIKIPLLPQGVPRSDNDMNIDVYNINREGLIPIIASAFRFYRGGLRFRLVWRASYNCAVRIEHRPDERLQNLNMDVAYGHGSVYNDGYSCMIQHTETNRIIEFEVPFYQCGVLGLLQNPKIGKDLESYHFSLGNIYIGFSCRSNAQVAFDLYYSLADDCRFSVFQGFPMVMPVPNFAYQAEMGLWSDVKTTFRNVADASEKVKHTVDELSTSPLSSIEEKKTTFFSWLTHNVPDTIKSVMVGAFSQILQVIINPTWKAMTIAFGSFLTQIGILKVSLLDSFMKYWRIIVDALKKCSQAIVPSGEGKKVSDTKVVLEANMDDSPDVVKAKAGIVSTIISSIAYGLGNIRKIPKTIPDFLEKSWNDLCKFTTTSNSLFKFFENNMNWLSRCYHWVLSKCKPVKALAAELAGADVDLKEFAEEALVLTSAVNSRKVEYHPVWNMRVYACAAKAQILYIRLITAEKAPKTPAMLALLQKVLKLRDTLASKQISPPVRFEPWVIAISGSSNVGKSHILQNIGQDILDGINYKTYGEMVFTRTPGQAYWNGLKTQPICLYDDYITVDGEQGLQQVTEVFSLKSRAVFNPPQAAIEDKHIRYNPLMVCLAMNIPFPKVGGIQCYEAFYRRRDMLIFAEKDQEFYARNNLPLNTSPNAMKKKYGIDISKYPHLIFKVARDVCDDQVDLASITPIRYPELYKLAFSEFLQYYENEMEKYEEALNMTYRFIPDDDEDYFTMQQNLDKQKKNLRDINKYRLGNLDEVIVYLKDAVSKIVRYNEYEMAALIPHISTLLTVDKKLAQVVVNHSVHLQQYLKATNRFPELYGESSTKSKKKTLLEGNMGLWETHEDDKALKETTMICKHRTFNPSSDYFRDDETKIDSPGEFACPETLATISELPCELANCPWKDYSVLRDDMIAWKNYKHAPHRAHFLRIGKFCKLPKFFHPTKAEQACNKMEAEMNEKVARELETWKEWAVRQLKSLPRNLWNMLVWAGKIATVVGSIFAFYGIIQTVVYPEKVITKLEQAMLDSGISYKHKVQNEMAKIDAQLLTKKLLAEEKHLIQTGKSVVNEPTLKVPQMVASGDPKVVSQKIEKPRDVAIKMVANMSYEHESVLLRTIRRNTMFIEAERNGKVIRGRLLGLVGRYAICVDHYNDKLGSLDLEDELWLVSPFARKKVKFEDLEYKQFVNSSIGYYKVPIQFGAFRNLIKHISPQINHSKVGPLVKVIETDIHGEVIITRQVCERVLAIDVPASNDFKAFNVPDGYRYSIGGRGMCGSVLLSENLNERPIIGIHVAGDIYGRVGISEAITCEQFNHLINESEIQDVIEPNMIDWTPRHIKPNSHCHVLGLVPSSMAHREPGRSAIIPTECYGQIFPATSDVPVLSPNDPRIQEQPFIPLQEGINKHGLTPLDFPEEFVENAYQDLKHKILAKVKPLRLNVGTLPVSVAVVGDPDIEGFDKLDFKTSEGFPFVGCRTGNQKNKSWLLNLEQDNAGNYVYIGCDDLLTEIMARKNKQRLSRILPFTVFTDCLKDAKISLDKVLMPGKVRIFSISPLDYTIQSRQYMMDFSAAYKIARFDAEHAVGINANSYEWTELSKKMLKISNNIITADYANFGPTLNAICALKVFKIIRDWYKFNGDNDENNDLIREFLGYEVIFSLHLATSTIYRTMCGLPSGGPLTVVQNSMVNSIYVRVCWQIIFTDNLQFKHIQPTMECMHSNLVFIVYGDDIIAAASDEIKEAFNCYSLNLTLSKYEIGIKNASKTEDIVKYLPLIHPQTSFLKRTFKPHLNRVGVMLAPLEMKSILDICNWTHRVWAYDIRQASLVASDACIRESFGHGELVYSDIRDKIFYYWNKKGEHLLTPTWREVDAINYI